jgi:hypothetical protein
MLEDEWIITKMYQWMLDFDGGDQPKDGFRSKLLDFVITNPFYPCTMNRLHEIISSYPLLRKPERNLSNLLNKTFVKDDYRYRDEGLLLVNSYNFKDDLPSPYKEIIQKYKRIILEDYPVSTRPLASDFGFRSDNGEAEGRKSRRKGRILNHSKKHSNKHSKKHSKKTRKQMSRNKTSRKKTRKSHRK